MLEIYPPSEAPQGVDGAVASLDELGWSGTVASVKTSTSQKRQAGVHGGERSIRFDSGIAIASPLFKLHNPTGRTFKQGRVACGMMSTLTGRECILGVLGEGLAVDQLNSLTCRISTATGLVSLYRGNTIIQTYAAGITTSQWYHIEMDYIWHDTTGEVTVYLDEVALTPSFSGDTNPSAVSKVDRVFMRSSSNSCYFDDIVYYSKTMKVDGISGTPISAGGVLEIAGGGGGEFTVTDIEYDGTEAIIIVEGWNGIGFADNDTLDIQGGASSVATVYAPTAAFVDGFEPNSAAIGNLYIQALFPNGDSTPTDLTRSTGSTNYERIDEGVPVDSEYNSTTTANQTDIYTIDDSNIPVAAEIAEIAFVQVAAVVQSDLTGIDHAQGILKISGTEYPSDDIDLPSSPGAIFFGSAVNPATEAAWSRSDITTLASSPDGVGLEFTP